MITVILLLSAEYLFSLFLLFRSGHCRSRLSRIISGAFIFIAFALRYSVLDYETADYTGFLAQWVEYFRLNGGFAALKNPIGNYNIPYLYFLAFFSYLNIPDLYMIKLLSIFFDVVLAFASMKLCEKMLADARTGEAEYVNHSVSRPAICFIAVMFLPTVFLNGSLWGQCDSIYVALALMGIWLALDDRPVLSVVFAALSFGFKLQAVFILPVYAILYFKGKFRLWHALVFPATYIFLVLPAVLCGRPFIDTITLYFSQTGSIGDGLNYNSPSLFALFDGYGGLPEIENTVLASKIGIAAAFIYMLAMLTIALIKRKQIDNRQMIIFAALITLGIPFLLPHMHDRYFFGADILFLILAFGAPETAICAFGVQFASLLGYHAYLKMRYFLMMRYGTYALVAVIAYTFTCLLVGFRFNKNDDVKSI